MLFEVFLVSMLVFSLPGSLSEECPSGIRNVKNDAALATGVLCASSVAPSSVLWGRVDSAFSVFRCLSEQANVSSLAKGRAPRVADEPVVEASVLVGTITNKYDNMVNVHGIVFAAIIDS